MVNPAESVKVMTAVVAVLLAGLVLLDLSTPDVAFASLFALSPALACATLPPRLTAAFGGAAVLAATGSLLWDPPSSGGQMVVRMTTVTSFSAAAVLVSVVRVRRENDIRHLTSVAEVAQRAVLPVLPAHARRVDIAGRYESATAGAVIGGDLYDCYHSRTHTRFLIGDVRGKGIGAVEQAARVIRAFRQAAGVHPGLEEVADDINDYLTPFLGDEDFVTAVLLDTTTAHRPQLVTAGHPPPLLVHPDGRARFIRADADLPLGLGLGYTRHHFTWSPGDRLLLYTDGLSEARNDDGDFLELTGLGRLLQNPSIETAVDDLLAAVRVHAGAMNLGDDVAIVLLEHAAAGREYLPSSGEHDWRDSLTR